VGGREERRREEEKKEGRKGERERGKKGRREGGIEKVNFKDKTYGANCSAELVLIGH
jgi:hypothetical protein